MPSSRFEHSAVAATTPEAVWDALQNAETWSAIGPVERVWDAVHDAGALQSYRWSATVGPRNVKGTATTIAATRPGLMQVQLDAGEIKGDVTAEMAATGTGTTLSVSLQIRGNGFLSSMFWDVISGAIGGGLPARVDAFAGEFGS